MLDKYITGSCQRIAPEASVPVIDVNETHVCLGGAANVAANLSALGAQVSFCTVTGDDSIMDDAKKLLQNHNLTTDNFVTDASRVTIAKTRVQSANQLIVRYDEGTEVSISAETEAALIKHIEQAYERCNAVLIADYGKGVMTHAVVAKLEELQKKHTRFIAVDAKCYKKYKKLIPDLIKPNYNEALKIVGEQLAVNRKDQVLEWGERLLAETNARHIMLTMDKDGIAYFNRSEFVLYHEVEQVLQPQVSGAGDTFISACLLAMLTGVNIEDTIGIAASAANVAIQKAQTAMCGARELEEKFISYSKDLPLKHLKKVIDQQRQEGKRIVFTNGCFDILHSGHVKYLTKAKQRGDILIVGLNNDESIKRLKGFSRPINNLQERVEVLSGLACIDYVVTFGKEGDDTPIQLIKALKPHVFVKGGDYTFKFLPEKEIIDKIGCQLEFIPFVDNKSTSSVIRRIQDNLRSESYVS